MGKNIAGQMLYDLTNLNEFIKKCAIKNPDGVSFRDLKQYIELKMSMFEYEGLPDDLPSEVVRGSLMWANHLCFYKSAIHGVVFCRYLPTSTFNKYMLPDKVDLVFLNGNPIANNVPFKDIVRVRDNLLDIPPILWLMEYFEELHNVENTLNKVLDVLKLPCVFSGTEKNIASFKTLIKKALNFEPFAVGDKQAVDAFNQFNIDMPVKLDEYISVYKNYKNMALESIGISGTETQKRERLLVGEVESQSEYKNLTYTDFKRVQDKWIKECNEKLGTNFKLVETLVEYQATELDRRVEEARLTAEAENVGGDDNGNDV